jgi:Protein of unknown function (DUF1648).
MNRKILYHPKHVFAGSMCLTLFLGFVSYPFLPEAISVHWDSSGAVDLKVPKYLGIVLIPVIIGIVQGIFELSSTSDDDGELLIRSLSFIFMSLVHVLVLLFNLGLAIPIFVLIVLSTVVFVAISLYINSDI